MRGKNVALLKLGKHNASDFDAQIAQIAHTTNNVLATHAILVHLKFIYDHKIHLFFI